ncbi:hypothetical protein B1748_29895 [Paenibacillus sp. MY03]|uniref:GNAT family N-acetyltransferase n=1 Tax=Paenibacillus sp. MY03 TaxID=302980 RepID=UPI000B3C31C8|nr:GNAT family protein [Paenibacillus sp. MY03]OUS69948.1 hypothetical protein B1748_29895 [Paenibacillus sp. MY03]
MINGERIILRALNQSDSILLLHWVNNPRLKELTGTVYPVSELEHKQWFEKKIVDQFSKIFGIEDTESKKLIGIIGLKQIDFINRNAELYIYIGEEDLWGQGLGTESVKLMVEFAFKEMNLHRIQLFAFSYNTRAIRSYEKAGFIVEGILKESVFRAGAYHDRVLMGIISK